MGGTTERIWNHFHDDLAQFIRRRVHHEADAADVLQDTFLRIHNGIEHLRDEDRVMGWVYRIARNTITDHHRSKLSPEVGDVSDASVEEPLLADNLNQTVGAWLVDMIDALPPEYGDAMRLTEIQGLTQREMATQLELSVSGAKSRVQRGRSMLRDLLLECCHIDLDRFGNVVDYTGRAGCQHCCDSDGAATGCESSGCDDQPSNRT